MKGYSITLIFLVLVSINICAQIELPAEELEKITSPRYIQRTMNLLQTSTPEQRNTVRILIYGQSLSAQDWWLDVKQYFEKQFPHADLIMNNKSIGGFSSQFLTKTVKRDILDYYPDLVIFHVFGSDHFYEQVLLQMRSLTSTEILIWNDPQNKTEPNEWHEEMSYKIIPSFAIKYKCMLIDVRTPINKFIKEKNLNYADEFTRDGLHFNEKGCKLLASNIIPHLIYDSKFEPDPDNLLKVYEIGKDISWTNGKLILPFEGNRIDVVTRQNPMLENTCQVYIDGKRPSEFTEAYNHTRPNDNGDKGWIWNVASPVRIQRKAPWVNETFTLTFDSINYDTRYFTFHVQGSECGFEGNGNYREDFLSGSGRVFLPANDVLDSIPGDWHVFRTFDITKFKIENGYKTTWKTFLMGSDNFIPKHEKDNTLENSTTLFKGISNGKHTLTLVSEGEDVPEIEIIKVYRPLISNNP